MNRKSNNFSHDWKGQDKGTEYTDKRQQPQGDFTQAKFLYGLSGFKQQWQQLTAGLMVFLVFCSGLFASLLFFNASDFHRPGKTQADTKIGQRTTGRIGRLVPVSRGSKSFSPAQGKRDRGERTSVAKHVYSRDLSMVVVSTAYTYTGNNTASGIPPRRGVIAVDPRVIPLGTKVYVEGYGLAVAADTGGAIKGKKIDVFLESRNEALNWGRRKVVIHILK